MDRACFRRNYELVSAGAEVVSAGAEDLVLGVVCVGWAEGGGGGGGGESASDSRQNGSLSRRAKPIEGHVWPLYWNAVGESASNSRQNGSLSPGKREKTEKNGKNSQ